jgi:hypothetical protein
MLLNIYKENIRRMSDLCPWVVKAVASSRVCFVAFTDPACNQSFVDRIISGAYANSILRILMLPFAHESNGS